MNGDRIRGGLLALAVLGVLLAAAGPASANHFETDVELGPRADLPAQPKDLEVPAPQDITAACPDVTDCAVSVEWMEIHPVEVDTSTAQQTVQVVVFIRDTDP